MPEHTIAENLQRLKDAKTAIGSAITAKGGTVGSNDGLEEFAADIATIPSGGDDSGHFIKGLLPLSFKSDGTNLTDYTIYGKSGGLNGVSYNVYPPIDDNSINRGYWGTNTTGGMYDEPCYNYWNSGRGLCNEINLAVGTYTFSVYVKGEGSISCKFFIDEESSFPHYSDRATISIVGSDTCTTSWDYQRFSVTFEVTAAGYVAPRIQKTADDGNNIYITCWQLESGEAVSSYVVYNATGITLNTSAGNVFLPLATDLGEGDTLTLADTGVNIPTVNGVNVIDTPIVGKFDMRVKGNISSLTLGTKDIVANGTYTASSDGLDGYSEVTVDVPGGVTPAPMKDVNFIDYDGTVVQSYSADDFANLSAMPENPSHEGLTAQGWNWSLADAKTYVASNGKLNIGQMYITSDGKTRLYISLPEGRTSPTLQLYLNANSELDIDWGDESTHSTFTSTSADYKSERHEYSAFGNYVIAITVVSGGFVLQSSSKAVSSILWDGVNSSTSPDISYNTAIKKIEIGGGVTSIGDNAFKNFRLSSVTIPNSVTSIGDNAFQSCYTLSSITIPDSVTSIGNSILSYCYLLSSVTIPDSVTSIGNSAFSDCRVLTSITIPDSVTSIGTNAFQNCYSLSSITIPNKVTSIGNYTFNNCTSLSSITLSNKVTSIGTYAFQNCYSLSSITIPNSVTSISTYVFNNCSYMSFIKFESTTPPAVFSSNAWNNVSTSTKILVPTGTLATYKSATNYPNPSTYTYAEY